MPVYVRIVMEKEYSDWADWDQGRAAIVNKLTAMGWSYKINTEE